MAPGILWVSSRIVNKDKLGVEKLCDWYENTHIQEVLDLPGFLSAARYEAVTPVPNGMSYGKEAPWLTTYAMPDVDYRLSQAFKNLAGETPPSADVTENIYKHSRFDTRFYEERATFSSPSSSASAAYPKFLISATFHAPKNGSTAADFTTWFKTSHLPKLEKTPGFVRAKAYETVVTMVLDQWNFMAPPEEVPRWLVMSEFAGDTVPNFEQVDGGVDVGVYRIGRVYSEEEWGSVGK